MKQMDVFKKIGGILKELNDQYDYLAADSNDLNELELELFVANAHFLKDHAEILRRLHERSLPTHTAPPAETPEPVIEKPTVAPTPEKKQEPVHEQHYFEPVVQQKLTTEKFELSPTTELPVQPPYNPVAPEPIITPEHEEEPVAQIDLTTESPVVDSYSFEREDPELLKQELEIDAASEWEDEDDQFEQEELTEQLPPLSVEKEHIPEPPFTLATNGQDLNGSKENSEDKVLTINQKISALKAEKEKGPSQPALLPITDLKSAINLNDKLLYIKDLFNGYSLAYSEAVEIVNRFNSFEEAERFLKTNYVVKNHWADKPITAEKFYDLLRRRYPAS
ncbi:hypothetical protein [Mucilaginibacter aquaedulcis]|uniref:hypothetical protein n=1 Tax=Mucilaginibacter aquaedulcis TaxID=1187081 RepID=UPI0025B31EDA|nr:hypothetical protein [Mucilaginibacter aquaedulcis]MDN3549600.1 hypothetical protein [Mucilaginibacter aquaedulcis]